MNLLDTDGTEHTKQQKDESRSCASIQKEQRMDLYQEAKRNLGLGIRSCLIWAVGNSTCRWISCTLLYRAHRPAQAGGTGWGWLQVITLNEKSFCTVWIRVIPTHFAKMIDCVPILASQSSIVVSPLRIDESKEQSEGTRKRHSTTDTLSRNSFTGGWISPGVALNNWNKF